VPVDESFIDHDAALKWCDAEGENLAAATRLAVEVGYDEVAAQLPIAMWGYLSLRKPWTIWLDTHKWGLVAAQRSQNRRAEAYLLTNIGIYYRDRHQPEEALTNSQKALIIREEVGDRWGKAWNLTTIGAALSELHRDGEAVATLRQAVDIRHEVGDTQGLGRTLGFLGDAYRKIGLYHEAMECFEEARSVGSLLNNPRVLGHALQGLALTYYDLDENERALDTAAKSIDTSRLLGDRLGEAQSHALRGSTLVRIGLYPIARTAWTEALKIFEILGDKQAETARSELRKIPMDTPTTDHEYDRDERE
jgi:tetratricopeptide (TPR) repeat protein